jgi:putative acetyltransferase
MLRVRPELPDDATAIRAVNVAAFPTPEEADIVDALRAAHAVVLSLVAVDEDEGRIVGHILFSPVTIDRPGTATVAIGLAPMAVAPSHQRRGIGEQLVRTGLEALRAAGQRAVVVVGHPGYYPRFGFAPGRSFDLRWEAGHDEAFFALELAPGALAGGGVVRYRPELGGTPDGQFVQ